MSVHFQDMLSKAAKAIANSYTIQNSTTAEMGRSSFETTDFGTSSLRFADEDTDFSVSGKATFSQNVDDEEIRHKTLTFKSHSKIGHLRFSTETVEPCSISTSTFGSFSELDEPIQFGKKFGRFKTVHWTNPEHDPCFCRNFSLTRQLLQFNNGMRKKDF